MKQWLRNGKKVLLFLALLLIVSILHARNVRDTMGIGARILFSENKGQWEDRVLFRSQMHASTLFVERDCFTFVVQHPENATLHHPVFMGSERYRTHSYRIHFEGSKAASVEGGSRQPGYENYYLGRDPARWASGVGVYEEVRYHDLYPGIDLKVYTGRHAMKYDFIVAPGADPSFINMRYEGTEGIRLQGGNIVVKTSVMDIVEMKPYAYQTIDGIEHEVEVHYSLKEGQVHFELGNYDQSLPLVIDPYLYFSTYTGSTADNWGTTGTYDSYKNTYTSGVVFSTGYPVSVGSYDGSYNGNCDIGIFKFDTSGSQRLYATYLGGSMADMPHSMFVNAFDELVIFGTTGSSDFPVSTSAYDTSFNGGTSLQYEGSSTINFPNGVDIFISRFNSDGSQLQASTYVGGNGNDGLNYRNSFSYDVIMLGNDSLYYNYGDGARGELITDDNNNIYVGSTTTSTNFPVSANCVQATIGGGQDGIVFKIDYNLSNLMWSTYLGGAKDDAIYSIDVDNDYNVLVCGGTNSLNFPTTTGAYRTFYNGGSADAFVAKISYYGHTLMASTLFGSSAYDQCYFVRNGKGNDIFLFGQTKASGSTMIHNANYNTPNSGQFLARFKQGLDTLVWSTVFGTGNGEPNLSPTAFAADICNRVYLSGWGRIFCGRTLGGTYRQWNTTGSGTNGLTVSPGAYQTTTDGQDFYIMSMDANASGMVYATFFGEQHTSGYSGNDHVDGGTSRFDRGATLYQSVCASCGGCDDFPVSSNAWSQHNNSNNCNNAIFRLGISDDFPVAEFQSPATGCSPYTVNFNNTGRGTTYIWDFGDGGTSTLPNPSHTYTTPGQYTVRLIANMPTGCSTADTMEKTVMVLGNQTYYLDTLTTCPDIPLQIGLRPSMGCTYHWTGGTVSDPNIANPFVTTAGTYTLIINNGTCTDTAIQVVQIGEASFTLQGDTVSCSSPTQVTAVADGSSLIYHWSSNNLFSDTLNSNMHIGTYSFVPDSLQWLYIHVIDNLGCEKTDSIHIRFYRVVDTVLTVDPTCPNGCDGTATVLPTTAAMMPYSYNWGGGWGSTNSLGGICDGQYQVTFLDANGCKVTTPYIIASPDAPTIDASVEHIHCLEYCTGSISLTISGPSVYTILWLDDSSTAATRTDLCAGDYIVQISDSNACTTYDTITILENVDMTVSISGSSKTCADICSGRATVTVNGGTAPLTYQWNSGEQTATAEELCPGTATVTVTDAVGCSVSDSTTIEIQNSFANVQVWADDTVIFAGQSTRLHATQLPFVTYHWTPVDMVDNANNNTTDATPEDTTTYVVTLTDTLGCTYTDSVTIHCITIDCGKSNIFVPNAFTPNDDGKNDRLCFSGEWIESFEVAIFTRWGELVYESDDINECWDGRYKNNMCMPGVYVYVITITCGDGKKSDVKGDVTLIR